ncbi:MAG: phage holin family protein, partial [Pseudorhizobium sp.]
MSNQVENRPLSELLSGLVSDFTGLFRKEIDLAKTEAS